MKPLALICTIFLFFSCFQNKEPLVGKTVFQKELNATFKDASKSPLKKKDRKAFKGLDFFEVDSAFVVKAIIEHQPNSDYFNMPTTTGEFRKERVFGVLHFNLKGSAYKLNVYESKELKDKKGYNDYLFLPFLDQTNGNTTYGGGRYIELRLPQKNKAETVIIDFNEAFNPYCAYNENYSCPIVPRKNYLDIEILAGVKAFNKVD